MDHDSSFHSRVAVGGYSKLVILCQNGKDTALAKKDVDKLAQCCTRKSDLSFEAVIMVEPLERLQAYLCRSILNIICLKADSNLKADVTGCGY